MASNNGYLTHCRICGTPIFSLGNRQFCSACYAQNRRNAAHRSNAEAKMRREQAKREPLMPCSPGKARLLLKQQKACVVKRTPFTIKLLFGSAGYKHKVLYKGQECFVSGRRSSGSFALKKLDGTSISKGVTFKKLRLLEPATNYLIERM